MTRWWADTLFKRLFLLMWFGLVLSHLIAFEIVKSTYFASVSPPGNGAPFPVLPSLPPVGLGSGVGPPAGTTERDGAGSALPGSPPDGEMHRPGGDLPPFGPPSDPARSAGQLRPRGGLSRALWLDYGIRVLVIGVVAWFGARWLSTPMRRLAAASEALGAHGPPQLLDTGRGTLEVRQTAQVFNAMASRLHAQFGAQALLLAAISHDLRTPLARLRLRLEAMGPGVPVERSVDDVREMDALIGSVLGMLREQHMPSEPGRVDLAMLVQALVDDLADQGRPVTLVGDPCVCAPPVVATTSALKRVVGNLLGNALAHGGVARVRIERDEGWIRVVVDDDGPGIPVGQLDAVFEPFRRGHAETRRSNDDVGSGHGLGLYIARDLAERCGGRIVLGNRPEGGLSATLQLPAG